MLRTEKYLLMIRNIELMVFAMLSTSLGTLTILSAITELFKKRLILKGK